MGRGWRRFRGLIGLLRGPSVLRCGHRIQVDLLKGRDRLAKQDEGEGDQAERESPADQTGRGKRRPDGGGGDGREPAAEQPEQPLAPL